MHRSDSISAIVALLLALASCGCAGADGTGSPISSFSPSSSVSQTACTDGIFSPAPGARIDVRKDPALIRQRAVLIDTSRLDASSRVMFNLFEDVCLVAVRERVDGSQPGDVWTGTIEGVPGSSVTLVTSARAVVGSIVSPPNTFQIRVLEDDVHLVNQVDPSKYPQEKPPGRGGSAP